MNSKKSGCLLIRSATGHGLERVCHHLKVGVFLYIIFIA